MPDVGNCVGDVATHFASGDFVGVVGKREVFNICKLVNEHSHFNQGAGNGERKRRIYMFDYQGTQDLLCLGNRFRPRVNSNSLRYARHRRLLDLDDRRKHSTSGNHEGT